jgi:hypothetical protein
LVRGRFAAFPPQGISVAPTMSAFESHPTASTIACRGSPSSFFHSVTGQPRGAVPGRKAVAAAPMCEQEIGQKRNYENRSRIKS